MDLKAVGKCHLKPFMKIFFHISKVNGFIQRKFRQEMAPLSRDIIFIILQYLYNCNMYESAQNLEQESKVYFNLETFAAMIENGPWEKVHKYLRSFIEPNDNYDSMMVFWKIGREKYFEALDEKDFGKALSIFEKDLKPLWLTTPECTRELTELITLENFREKREYAKCGDTKTMRAQLVEELVDLLKHHPIIKYKLHFPRIDKSRLETLLSQSVDWQHFICHNAAANPTAMSTLFADHVCKRSSSFDPRQSVDAQLILNDPRRNDQNHGAGPSLAPRPSYPFFNPSVWHRP